MRELDMISSCPAEAVPGSQRDLRASLNRFETINYSSGTGCCTFDSRTESLTLYITMLDDVAYTVLSYNEGG